MKSWILPVAALLLIGSFTFASPDADRQSLLAQADRAYTEKSFAVAHDLYLRIDQAKATAAERRSISFRIADTAWRSFLANPVADTTILETSRNELQQILRDTPEEGHDRVWAEAEESLGELGQRRPDLGLNWSESDNAALDWWASQSDLALARQRYLAIVWRMVGEDTSTQYYGYVPNVPLPVLENAARIADSRRDRARANLLLATALGGSDRGRADKSFQKAIAEGKESGFYDRALFFYGQWAQGGGRTVRNRQGQLVSVPDYELAVTQFRKLTTEFSRGESRFYDQAAQALTSIVSPQVNIVVSNVFLPGSEITLGLAARNVDHVDFALYRVDLMRDLKPTGKTDNPWVNWIERASLPVVKRWSRPVAPPARYAPVQETFDVDMKLPRGSYLVVASGGGVESKALALVSDLAVVSKHAPNRLLEFVCNSSTGAPSSNARVRIIEIVRENSGNSRVVDRSMPTNGEGIAEVPPTRSGYSQTFVVASDGASQIFDTNYNQYYGSSEDEISWHIYAFTDRPAYRPDETVQWKSVVRAKQHGEYTTPANKEIEYQITDPRGNKVKDGKARLNTFGSAWDSLPLTASMPLGQYNVTFFDEGRGRTIGSAQLFRLEEYKLPEFRVSVKTPDENGRRKSYQLGDTVDVTIAAEYYFGGPVANATMEVLVNQAPFYPYYIPDRDYPWYYDDMRSRNWYGGGQLVKKEILHTDSAGVAHLTIETQPGSSGIEYTIEARVTDASRREVTESSSVRVAAQPYFAYLTPEHFLHRPGSSLEVKLKTLDPNDQPIEAAGQVHVTRQSWTEVWLAPDGREVSGAALRRLRESNDAPDPAKGWRLKSSGYSQTEVLHQPLTTDRKGEATLRLTAGQEGFYRIWWTSDEPATSLADITAETNIWVSDTTPTDLGYHSGGLQLIVDREQLRAGTRAPVLITAPSSGRTVLFAIEGDELFETRVIRMTQPVRLEMFDVDDRFVPNAFLTASSVFNEALEQSQVRVVVPPEKHFIQVDVKPSSDRLRPRQESDVVVTTRDIDGRPVSAEVALSVSDQAVEAIQADPAADPRQFFFGERQGNRVATSSTFNSVSYRRRDEDKKANKDELERGVIGGVVGGVIGATPAPRAVSEAITVTANAPALAGQMFDMAKASDRRQSKELNEDTVEVRSDFRSTAFWQPSLITDASGTGRAHFKYPDSTTSWRLVARAVTTSTQVGIGSAATVTQQPLIVRLQAPRFFVVGDVATISAVINNNTSKPLTIAPSLDAKGLDVLGGGAASLTVPANGEKRVDWTVKVAAPGSARLRVTGKGEESDAMERTIPIYDHGIEKRITRSGKTRGDDTILSFDIPAARRSGSTRVVVQATPSLAVTMLDALPYLIDYPYGCTEQTMSRFLPAAIVRKALKDLGVAPEVVASRLYGGIELATAGTTHPNGKKLEEMDEAIRQGLSRLYDFQHSDGGWGWWKEGSSDPWMSAYVLWGMSLARNAGIDIRSSVMDAAGTYLEQNLVQMEEQPDMQAWMLHALSAFRKGAADTLERKAIDNVWTRRDRMRAYGRALFALSLERFGEHDRALTMVRNLQDGVKGDRTPDKSILVQGSGSGSASVMATAHWGEDGFWWHWHDGPIESTAFALQALIDIDPGSQLVEPVMNWLVKNRRGDQWTNTRDSAISVLSLNEYLKKSGELSAPGTFAVSINGHELGTVRSEGKGTISALSRFVVPAASIADGRNEIRFRRKSGTAPLYVSATATFFSLEEPIPAEGHELFVRRDYYRLVPRETLLKGFVYDRRLMHEGETVKSGERVEVVETIETKNDYEYLLFEDLKPAGLEATELQSGGNFSARELRETAAGKLMKRRAAEASSTPRTLPVTDDGNYTGRSQWVYRELRDRKVAMFIDHLPQGTWEMRYELRAEVPGTYHALPFIGQAMYVPEIYANGEEQHVRVGD